MFYVAQAVLHLLSVEIIDMCYMILLFLFASLMSQTEEQFTNIREGCSKIRPVITKGKPESNKYLITKNLSKSLVFVDDEERLII